jgi:hypothetical protein
MTYDTAEREAIGLCIALEAVNDIAKHALPDLLDLSSSPGEAQVRYKSHVHQQLFLIGLLDFAKEGGDQALTGTPGASMSCSRLV